MFVEISACILDLWMSCVSVSTAGQTRNESNIKLGRLACGVSLRGQHHAL